LVEILFDKGRSGYRWDCVSNRCQSRAPKKRVPTFEREVRYSSILVPV
jgi:hypothetical protein